MRRPKINKITRYSLDMFVMNLHYQGLSCEKIAQACNSEIVKLKREHPKRFEHAHPNVNNKNIYLFINSFGTRVGRLDQDSAKLIAQAYFSGYEKMVVLEGLLSQKLIGATETDEMLGLVAEIRKILADQSKLLGQWLPKQHLVQYVDSTKIGYKIRSIIKTVFIVSRRVLPEKLRDKFDAELGRELDAIERAEPRGDSTPMLPRTTDGRTGRDKA